MGILFDRDLENLRGNKLIDIIKVFGTINNDKSFKFKKCPNNIDICKKYIVIGEKENIVTKVGPNSDYFGIICENILEEKKEYKWKLKILKTGCNAILVGVAQ